MILFISNLMQVNQEAIREKNAQVWLLIGGVALVIYILSKILKTKK